MADTTGPLKGAGQSCALKGCAKSGITWCPDGTKPPDGKAGGIIWACSEAHADEQRKQNGAKPWFRHVPEAQQLVKKVQAAA